MWEEISLGYSLYRGKAESFMFELEIDSAFNIDKVLAHDQNTDKT